MKTSKKILSIVLAVMLLVGTVVIGVSADTTMVYEKAGSKLVYTAVADKAANDAGVIELKPGETVKVEVYAQANYYLGTTGSEIFAWTAGFFNAFTEANVTTHNFVNNYTPNKKVIAAASASQLGNGYNKGTHEGYLFGRAYSTDCTSPYDASTATLAYTFTFTVPETATIGAKGEFRMPETCSATVATTSRMRQIYAAVNNSDSAYGSSSLGSQYPETIDLTGTILNFEVVSAVAPIDYTELNAQIARFDAEDNTLYTSDSWDAASDAYNFANAIKLDTEATQDDVDAAAKDLKDALDKLVLLEYCSYTVLQQAVNNCSELDAAEEYYSETALATWKAALADAKALLAADKLVLTDANQAIIDDAAEALNDAYDALIEMYVDTTALSAAIAAYKTTPKAEEYYDATEYEAWEAALAAAQDGVVDYDGKADTAENRAAVADLAADLKAAYEALDARTLDVYPLIQAREAYKTLPYAKEYYDAAEYDAWFTALDVVSVAISDYVGKPDTQDNRDAIAVLAADLKAAYEALDARFVDLTALNSAIAAYKTTEYAADYYDATEYAAWEAALTAAQNGVADYDGKADTAENRAEVADLAADLKAAYEALDARFVDLTALNSAIAAYKTTEYAAAYYDVAAYAAWEAALAAAQDGVADYDGKADTAANRAEVADLADDLKAAYEALAPEFMDYSALENAVVTYGTTPYAAEDYTEETYDPYAAALARAKDMLANKTQAPASDAALAAQIAAATTELAETYGALELAPVNTIVTAVKCTQEFYKVGDTVNFEFLCNQTNVTKLQIVFDNGSTSTYTRTHSAVTVVDNGDGTETWVVAVKVYYDEATATVRGKLGKEWEAKGLKFEMATSIDEDYSVKSAEVILGDAAVTEFMTEDTVTLKIVCGPNTLRMRLVFSDGTTSTFGRAKASQDADGNWVWLVTRTFAEGEYAYDIYTAGSSNKLTDEGTDLAFTVKAPVVIDGPSTGEDTDIVIEAAVAKARLVRDNQQTFTIVTDKNAWGVRVVDQYGVVQAYSKDATTATDNGDGTITWVLTTTCTVADTFNCTIDAAYGSSWMSNGATVSYKVVY